MDDNAFLSATTAHAEAAIAKLKELDLPLTAAALHVWNSYFAGDPPALVEEIDHLIADDAPITSSVCETLFEKHFGSNGEAAAVDAAFSSLGKVLAGIETDIADAHGLLVKGRDLLRLCCSPNAIRTKTAQETMQAVVRAAAHILEGEKGLRERLAVAGERLETAREGANAALADSRIDSLTKVANWKAFYGNLRSAAAEVAEKRGRLVVLMLDIDRFTTFNQRHGRANGDQLLRMIAAELQKTFGRGGFVARHGCDSFGIVLPGAETEAVVAMANAFRTAFASRKIINKATAQPLGVITLSIGVTEYRRGEALAHLMFRCRGALGLARTEGGDRVMAATAPKPGAT
ncbi:MAG: GGDEF domain-containing protein [Rhodospirillales bacterium]|nr:GGDEF domain-containing protein [Rhodospirillales bacterium]